MSSTDQNCGNGGGADTYTGLRIASIFVILATSACGTFFPVLTKRSKCLKVPIGVFESVFSFIFSRLYHAYSVRRFAKYFGSGVIVSSLIYKLWFSSPSVQVATAFIHLLSPALSELGSPCLSAAWQVYVRLTTLVSIFSQ